MASHSVITADAIASKDKPFPLLKLPPELWSKIGKLTVDDSFPHEPIDINYLVVWNPKICATWRDDWRNTVKEFSTALAQPAITRVCRAVRDELLPYYFRTKIDFTFGANQVEWALVEKWLWTIGEESRSDLRGLKCRMWWSGRSEVDPAWWHKDNSRFKVDFVHNRAADGRNYWDVVLL